MASCAGHEDFAADAGARDSGRRVPVWECDSAGEGRGSASYICVCGLVGGVGGGAHERVNCALVLAAQSSRRTQMRRQR